jgi:hypothetical protein
MLDPHLVSKVLALLQRRTALRPGVISAEVGISHGVTLRILEHLRSVGRVFWSECDRLDGHKVFLI